MIIIFTNCFRQKTILFFLEYFETQARLLIINQLTEFEDKKPKNIPEDFWINHIASTLIETLRWWVENNMKEHPKKLLNIFYY